MNGYFKTLLANAWGSPSNWELNHPHYPLVIAGMAIVLIIILMLTGHRD